MTDTSPWSSEFVQTTSVEAATQPLDRRRGQFNFLTWPFFLAQVFAIEQVLGDALRPPVVGEEAPRSDRSEGTDSGFETFPLEPRHKASGDDGEATSAVGSRTALLDDRLQLDKIATPPLEQENRESGNGNETQAAGGGGGSASGGSEAAPGAEADGASNVSAGLITAPPDLEPQGSGFVPFVLTSTGGFSIPIEAFTAPTAGTTSLLNDVTTVLGAAAPIAQVAFQPLNTLSSGLASVADDVLGLAAPIVQTVNPVLTTASDTLANLTGNVVEAAAPIAHTVGPVLNIAAGTVGDLTDTALGLAAPIVQTVNPVLTTASDTLVNLTGNVVEAAAPIAHTVGPVLDTAAGAVADLTGTALGVVTPIVHATGPLLATATNAVVDLGDGLLEAPAPMVQPAGPVLNTATHAITDLTAEVLGAAAPIAHGLDQVIAPATNTVAGLTDSTLDNVAPIVAHVGPALSTATTTVANLAGDLQDILPSVFHPANPVLANPTNPLGDDALSEGMSIPLPVHAVAAETDGVLGAVSNLTNNILRDVTPLPDAADQVLASGPGKIGDLLGTFDSSSGEDVFAHDARPDSQSPIANTSNVVPDVDNVLPLGHGLAADGAILFDDRSPAKDDLSGDGGYSQYAVAMRTDAVDTADRAGPDVDRENVGVGDLQSNRDHDQDQDASRSQDRGDDKHDNVLNLGHATSALDDIVLRGHDGLL